VKAHNSLQDDAFTIGQYVALVISIVRTLMWLALGSGVHPASNINEYQKQQINVSGE
jgi:hypothetical protein